VHLWLGELLTRTKRIKDGEREYQSSLKILGELRRNEDDLTVQTRMAQVMSHLAILKVAQGNYEDAERLIRDSIALQKAITTTHPNLYEEKRRLAYAYQGLAQTLWAMNRTAEADAAFRDSLKICEQLKAAKLGGGTDQQIGNLLFQYGHFLDDTSRARESADAFRRSIEIYNSLAPRYPENLGVQFRVLERSALFLPPQFRDLKRAVQIARAILQRDPTVSDYWSYLGIAHYRLGEYTAATEALGKALSIDPLDRDAALYLAMTSWKQGDREKARSFYEKASRVIDTYYASDFLARQARTETMVLMGMPRPPRSITVAPK
jgi:tetratricopeptide (TPR) repeat protein